MNLLKYAVAACAVLFAAVFLSTPARAATVNIDPGAYSGPYFVVDGSWTVTEGPQTLDLAPGNYLIQVAADSLSRVLITVDAAGQVSSANPDAMAVSGNTLTFQTADITIDPTADYTAQGGLWIPLRVTNGFLTGTQTVTVVRNLSYLIQVAYSSLARVRLHVDAAGNLTSENPVAISTSGATATFNTVDISVDPTAEYTDQGGVWSPVGATLSHRSGPLTFKAVPTLTYLFQVGYHTGTRSAFHVDAAGTISADNTDVLTASGSTLTMNTVDVTVDPTIDYSGDWYALGVLGARQSGRRTFKVPPTVPHYLRVGAYVGGDVTYQVDMAGNVTSSNTDAVTATGGTLTFETTTITIETDSLAEWQIHAAVTPRTFGDAEVTLVPNLRYLLRRGGTSETATFGVAAPCAIDTPVVEIAGDEYVISCGAADADDDGAPDDVDNCPLVANADQLDRDLDGIGDVCDGDLDGDGFANAGDNCPLDANAGQEDFDGDGIGNVCDDDVDGDAVADLYDNCPADPNPDQADSEGDGYGDVCDLDDDNDLVFDDIDNCPLDANAGQEDHDGDGAGDICDGDEDGDYVGNDADLCPLSPMDLPVNADGCTGGQAIALACKPENFVQHGQYVSCVANAANAAAAEGLISPREKSGFVKQAAKK
jgi:hypothetical protein